MSFKVDEMTSSVGQVDDNEDESFHYTDDVPMTLSFDESDDADSDAEEWLAEDGGTFRRMNTHLDGPRQKMMDTAFEMQSLRVGSSSRMASSVLHRIGSPSSYSPAQEGQSPFSRTKKVRRHEEEPVHDGGLGEDAALARRARHHNSVLPSSSTISRGASALDDRTTRAQSESATIHDWATSPFSEPDLQTATRRENLPSKIGSKRQENPPSKIGSRQQPAQSPWLG